MYYSVAEQCILCAFDHLIGAHCVVVVVVFIFPCVLHHVHVWIFICVWPIVFEYLWMLSEDFTVCYAKCFSCHVALSVHFTAVSCPLCHGSWTALEPAIKTKQIIHCLYVSFYVRNKTKGKYFLEYPTWMNVFPALYI